jgi:hypothetical protein
LNLTRAILELDILVIKSSDHFENESAFSLEENSFAQSLGLTSNHMKVVALVLMLMFFQDDQLNLLHEKTDDHLRELISGTKGITGVVVADLTKYGVHMEDPSLLKK